jgi:hypothetical protein
MILPSITSTGVIGIASGFSTVPRPCNRARRLVATNPRRLIFVKTQALMGYISRRLRRDRILKGQIAISRADFILLHIATDGGMAQVMRWFRTNRRASGTLALCALALQIALAFGHIHLRDFAGVRGVSLAQTRATAVDPTPSDRNTGHSSDDYCLICASINLAGTGVPPSHVALILPVESTDTSYRNFCSAFCNRVDRALFHARAPPLA